MFDIMNYMIKGRLISINEKKLSEGCFHAFGLILPPYDG